MLPTNDPVFQDASATGTQSLLQLCLNRLLVWVLLFAPACLSAALYIWEQHVPASFIFCYITAYIIFIFALCITVTIFRLGLSPRCRLVEPFAVYLVILINFCQSMSLLIALNTFYNSSFLAVRILMRDGVSHSDPFTVVIWLGLIIPAVELRVLNWAVLEEGRKDRVVDLQYFKRLFAGPFRSTKSSLARMAARLSELNPRRQYMRLPRFSPTRSARKAWAWLTETQPDAAQSTV
ncbi:hypothetical protein B0H13DRAFT_2524813 [Mycena leptocephala]|nr:hypothetical protein B0H13DRAFT_2524813 [Mycena leptocephala]